MISSIFEGNVLFQVLYSASYIIFYFYQVYVSTVKIAVTMLWRLVKGSSCLLGLYQTLGDLTAAYLTSKYSLLRYYETKCFLTNFRVQIHYSFRKLFDHDSIELNLIIMFVRVYFSEISEGSSFTISNQAVFSALLQNKILPTRWGFTATEAKA